MERKRFIKRPELKQNIGNTFFLVDENNLINQYVEWMTAASLAGDSKLQQLLFGCFGEIGQNSAAKASPLENVIQQVVQVVNTTDSQWEIWSSPQPSQHQERNNYPVVLTPLTRSQISSFNWQKEIMSINLGLDVILLPYIMKKADRIPKYLIWYNFQAGKSQHFSTL